MISLDEVNSFETVDTVLSGNLLIYRITFLMEMLLMNDIALCDLFWAPTYNFFETKFIGCWFYLGGIVLCFICNIIAYWVTKNFIVNAAILKQNCFSFVDSG